VVRYYAMFMWAFAACAAWGFLAVLLLVGAARADSQVSAWIAAAAAAAFAAFITREAWRTIRALRYPPGHCPKCGYDLRASPDRCPECGTPAAT
jgi:rubrerythrin